jgi:ComF family protein
MSWASLAGLAASSGAPRSARWRLPTLCAVCRQWDRERLCADCVRRFAGGPGALARCMRCALRVPDGVALCGACLREPPPFERAFAAFDYAYPWDGLIARFKFHGALDLAGAFARRMADAGAQMEGPRPTLVVPVPLSEERLRERGYNQAWELGRRVAAALRCPADAALLLRIRDTPHQLALPPARRAANVRGVFAVEPRRHARVEGQCVALVDDVLTTGATVAEAARVLLRAGAARVQVWMLARTPRPEDR